MYRCYIGELVLLRVSQRVKYFDKETNLHYNYFRDYDPAIGRYIQSDPIGLAGGINTYGYVGSNPLSLIDVFGLADFKNFPPEKLAQIKAALEEAKNKLRQCNSSDCRWEQDEIEKIIQRIDAATYSYIPNLPYCAETSRFPILVNTIRIGPSAFNFDACCDLSSTIAHEANHLRNPSRTGSEGSSRDLERRCFNCPRPR